jgi:chemotaxis protein histidine kinase CheA
VGDAETNSRQKLRSEDKKAKEAARAAERAEAKAAAEKQERLREETRRRAEKELKDIAAAAEKRARDAAKAAKAAKRREARELKLAKVREKEEHAAILEERKAWERAEARTRSEREKAEKKEEEEKRRAEKAAAFAEERERKAERAKKNAVLSSVPDTRETAESPDAYDVGRREDEESLDSYSEHDANASVALVPGHWIDPGEETGSPGERELNARIADKAHDELVLRGWTVLRPDEFVPPLDWDTYLDWARAQCARGVPLLEIHGQGSGAEMRGRVTGVISQTGLSEISGGSLSPLGDALAERFGRFPMDWRELVVSRVGGAVVESFETEVLERMPLKKREAAMDAIALDIADAVDSTRFTSTPPDDGCSASGCPRA